MFLRENLSNSLIQFQPSLIEFSFNPPPRPVKLDATSITTQNILVLDTYFRVMVHHGSEIAEWRKAGWHQQAEHGNFRDLLDMPKEHAKALMADRFPVPELLDCDQVCLALCATKGFCVWRWGGGEIAAWHRYNKYFFAFETFIKLLSDNACWCTCRCSFLSQGDSKSRHLVSVVNPSVTHNQSGYGSRPGEGHEVVTDDVTLKVFLEHLTKLAVQGPQ
jgi:hypothetical protein